MIHGGDIPVSTHQFGSIADWYSQHREILLLDVNETPPYRWVKRNKNSACGETTTERNAPVFLSYETAGIFLVFAMRRLTFRRIDPSSRHERRLVDSAAFGGHRQLLGHIYGG